MTGDISGTEFDSDFDRLDRPFEMESAQQLSRLSDLPEWKQPEIDNRMQNWEEDQPFAPTGFSTPQYLNDADWW